jgi:hypothetical protein
MHLSPYGLQDSISDDTQLHLAVHFVLRDAVCGHSPENNACQYCRKQMPRSLIVL